MRRKITAFIKKYERWITPTALFGGFVIDNLTLRRSDLLIENLLIFLYLGFLAGALLMLHAIQAKAERGARAIRIEAVLQFGVQFLFGGLFSALTVFYIKSASLMASWPFLLILFGGMIATEYLRKHFTQFMVQLSAFYILLFTYLIVVSALLFRAVNMYLFLLSGIMSLLLIGVYIFIFKKAVPSLFKKGYTIIISVILGLFVLINGLYFLNVIPPIPLSLKDAGIYKNVVRTDTDYVLSEFQNDFSFLSFKNVYNVSAGNAVYFYSSVFAPERFEQHIVHEWQRKDGIGKWTTVSRVSFPIYGGSETGYRGYSVSQKVTPGTWRVRVKTSGGQVLGIERFGIR